MDNPQETYERLLEKRRRRQGRPRGRQNNGPVVRRFAATYYSIIINGERQKLRPFDIVILTLQGMAMEGNVAASKYREELEEKYSSMPSDTKPTGLLVVPEGKSAEDWVKEQEALNQLRTAPGVLPLELYVKNESGHEPP